MEKCRWPACGHFADHGCFSTPLICRKRHTTTTLTTFGSSVLRFFDFLPPMPFQQHTLDNGLEIVAETSPDAYSSAFAFFVRTGARDESREVSGVSHFLEHMVFKGSANRSAADVNRDLTTSAPAVTPIRAKSRPFILP